MSKRKTKNNPQDRFRRRDKRIEEQVEAQASASAVGSSSIAAPPATPPIADPNLAEAVAALARVIPALTALTEKGIMDYCMDLKNMGCKVFTGTLKVDLA